MIGSICSNATAGMLSRMHILLSILKLLADGTLIQLLSGFNLMLVLIPALAALYLFLFLTRKKKEEETDNGQH